MADPTLASQPCHIPAPFEEDIEKLRNEIKQQDSLDKKAQLAEVVKINDEVQKTETSYEKDYPALKFQEKQSEVYETNRKDQLILSAGEKDKIKWIIGCFETVDSLEKKWKDARQALYEPQLAFQQAQDDAADKEAAYKAAQDYKTNQKELDALQTQSTKEFEAGNSRGTYFLLIYEMEPRLKPPKSPADYNDYLKQLAKDIRDAREKLRQKKVALDEATANAQAAKKALDEAKTKRRDNILKRIAEETFPTTPASTPASPAEGSSSEGTQPVG